MAKKEYSVELTKMLHQLKTNKGAPLASLRRFKRLDLEERMIYVTASDKLRIKNEKLFKELIDKGTK